ISTSSVGVGGSLDVEVLNKQTFAYIDNSADVTLGGFADIEAHGSESMLMIVATAGVGDSVGVSGSFAVAVLDTDAEAYVNDNASLLADGAVSIIATGNFDTTMIAGAIGAGGTAGVGVGNTDLIHSATVMAFIGHDADVSAGGAGLTV